MSRLALFRFLFLIFIIFFSKNLFAQNDKDVSPSGLENEVNLPIFDDEKVVLDNQAIKQNISLFNIEDLVTLFLFFLFFLVCIFLFKKLILKKKVQNNNTSDLIRELAFYEIDNKNSIRIINVLGTVYVLLVSSSSSVVLKKITGSEELADLEFKLNKSFSNINSFKLVFNKILRNDKREKSLLDDHNECAELENDIETSLKSKQDRLKKF
ncbi:flagellar biosynthesis protein FliZ [Borrelia persica]|uniref:flagellar biosynthesis protein FliZ n=1 Tax=Borrelia persica TaxID=44448 RepID=UPI000465B955|nr:flagellar biosynthesis protein FliZ [Borrelia persica]